MWHAALSVAQKLLCLTATDFYNDARLQFDYFDLELRKHRVLNGFLSDQISVGRPLSPLRRKKKRSAVDGVSAPAV